MEIKAKGIFDFESIKALSHLQMFGKNDPKKRMRFWSILFGILLVLVTGEILLFGLDGSLMLMMGCAVLCIALECFMYFILPKIQYNSLVKMKDIVNEYVFTEESMLVSSNGQNYSSQGEIKYSVLVKMYETSRYLFIFQNKAQAFIVDKNTIRDGSIEEVRDKIKNQMSGKYILCKY